MAKASINFKPVKSNSEIHNERIGELDYVYSDLTPQNEAWKADEINTRFDAISKLTKQLTGRKIQAKATPIREAVVNLNHDHSLADLQKLADALKNEKGIECFQIFIHRDEGKSRDDLNYHAHMVFDWQDKATGKSIKLNRQDMSQIQDLVSEHLGMERGEAKENSNTQRLEAVEYKRVQEEKRLHELQQLSALEQKKNRAAAEEYRRSCEQNKPSQEREEEGLSEPFKSLLRDFINSGNTKPLEKAKVAQRAIKWLEGKSTLLAREIGGLSTEIEAVEEQVKKHQSEAAKIEASELAREYRKIERQISLVEKEIGATKIELDFARIRQQKQQK